MPESEAYLIKNNAYVHDVADDIQDIIWRESGRLTAQNDSAGRCPGEQEIGTCDTARRLTRLLIQTTLKPKENMPEELSPSFSTLANRVTVNTPCDACSFRCHTATRIINGSANERIRFMFEELDE